MDEVFTKQLQKLTKKELQKCLTCLIDSATCSVCHQTLTPATALCINGHAVCLSHCQEQDLRQCPLCRENYSNVRPTGLIQQLLEDLPHPCRYEECTHFVQTRDDHEKYCGWRSVNCKLCDWEGSLCYIMLHVQTDHEDKLLRQCQTSTPFNPKVKGSLFFPIIIDNCLFWGEMQNDPDIGKLTVVIHFVSANKSLSVFTAKFILQKKEKKSKRVFLCKKLKAPFSATIDLNMDPQVDAQNHNCMCVPSQILHKYINNDKQLMYSITIKKDKCRSTCNVIKCKYNSIKQSMNLAN